MLGGEEGAVQCFFQLADLAAHLAAGRRAPGRQAGPGFDGHPPAPSCRFLPEGQKSPSVTKPEATGTTMGNVS